MINLNRGIFKRKKTLLCLQCALLLSLIAAPLCSRAQTNGSSLGSLAYLEQTFPKLTKLYRDELANCHAHYIFAIDVSGSMKKYDEIVTPALRAFVDALPAGEQVSIIPFGTDAKMNTPGLCAKIQDDSQKQVLRTALSTLYVNDGYSNEFRKNTDVKKAVEAVNQTVLNNQEVHMNVVVIITDFLNDLPNIGEQKLSSVDLEKLNKDFDNVTENAYTRVVAMQLPKAGTGAGFCLDQLQDKVFCNTSITRKFDIIQAINDEKAISHWFEQLTREIMTEKLRAVIQLDNKKNLRPSLKTKIDIDGNTTAEIHWTPNKLYRQIKIDSTYTDAGSNYVFENNKEVWQTTQDTALVDLKLGKLVHKHYGFRHYEESLNIGLSLPTNYDDELKKLSIDKPIQATTDKQSGWLFTFLLPFMLCCIIIAILIIWFFLVYKTAIYNKAMKINGVLTVKQYPKGKVIINKETIRKAKSIHIGQGEYPIEGSKWNIEFCVIPGKSWLLKKAKWGYMMKEGSIEGKRRNEYDSPKVKIDLLLVGPEDGKYTHTISIEK